MDPAPFNDIDNVRLVTNNGVAVREDWRRVAPGSLAAYDLRPHGCGECEAGQVIEEHVEADPLLARAATVTATARPGPVNAAVAWARVRAPVATGLHRERVNTLFEQVWQRGVAVVVAPAGYGKTTAVAAFAGRCGAPVAWYRAEAWDGTEPRLIQHLEHAMRRAQPGLAGGWRSAEDLLAAVERRAGERLLLVIDDLHAVEGTEVDAGLTRITEYAPAGLGVIVVSRHTPRFNLSRLRVDGHLLDVTADDLRFRAWEVERLFRDVYQERIAPEELSELTRRTEGWAAGLQLFHLATQGLAAHERRQVLAGLATHSRLVREYMTQNLLDQLPDELRGFLVSTAPLGCLNGALCDRFLARSGSQAVLQELERRQLFTQSGDGDALFSCHAVLRGHLQERLVEELGEPSAAVAFRHAGGLLEDAGLLAEALRAYSRGQDWDAVARLLGAQGERLVAQGGRWIDALPDGLVDNDPWLLLAAARQHRAEGRWQVAVQTYRRAEKGFTGTRAEHVCRTERAVLASWLKPSTPGARLDHWSGWLRAALNADPSSALKVPRGGPSGAGHVVRAVAALLRGRPTDSREQALEAAELGGSGPELAAAARALGGLASLLSGAGAGVDDLARASDIAERAGNSWLARLARAARALAPSVEGVAEAGRVRVACRRDGDCWGASLAALFQGWGGIRLGDAPSAVLEEAVTGFQDVGAGSLVAWAMGLQALAAARAEAGGARRLALQAEAFARQRGVPAAAVHAYAALVLLGDDRAGDYRSLAAGLCVDGGLAATVEVTPRGNAEVWPGRLPAGGGSEVTGGPSAALSVRCFGGLRVVVNGTDVPLSAVKPRVRSLLRLLAAAGGQSVHREVIAEALWPEVTLRTALRNLWVAISSLRQLLERGTPRGEWSLVLRDGDTYLLALPPGSTCDVRDFTVLLSQARLAQQQGDVDGAAALVLQALELHSGELLPEELPSAWAQERRDALRTRALETAAPIAAALTAAGRLGAAAEVCLAGLRLEATDDRLWRLLIEARDRSGDHGAAERARRQYRRVLAELGVTPR